MVEKERAIQRETHTDRQGETTLLQQFQNGRERERDRDREREKG